MWAVMITRPDLAYLMLILSQYLSNPGKEHVSLLTNVFCYISKTLDLELIFNDTSKKINNVVDYTDADFADAVDEQRSTEDFIFMLAEECISHQSKQQAVVTLSTCESEYMRMSEAEKKAI